MKTSKTSQSPNRNRHACTCILNMRVVENGNISHFYRSLSLSIHLSSPNILFPSPIDPFVSSRVLVQTLASGIPLSKFLGEQELDRANLDWSTNPTHQSIVERITKTHILKREQAARAAKENDGGEGETDSKTSHYASPHAHSSPLHSEIAHLGLQMYLHMLMQDNFVHSDLHPGNLLVQLPGFVTGTNMNMKQAHGSTQVEELIHHYNDRSSSSLKSAHCNLVVLDSGLVSELNQRNRKNFLALFGALLIRDGRLASHLILSNSPHQKCRDPVALGEDMHKIVSAIPLENIGRVDLGKLLGEVMNCVRYHQVQLEADFASLIISLAIIEGIGRQLEPDLSLFHEAVPAILKNSETRKILLGSIGVKNSIRLGMKIGKEENEYLNTRK